MDILDIDSLSDETIAGLLAAAADAELVRSAMAATAELVRVQAGAGDRAALTAATTARRAAIDGIVRLGVASLGGGSEARAQEVRDLVERVSRQPELLDAWLDGTLRDVPDEGLGFDAFTGFAPAPARALPRP